MEALRNKRVTVTDRAGRSFTGQLRGITPDTVWVAEQPVPRRAITAVEHSPLYCATCGQESLTLYDGLCAADTRKNARTQPIVREPCEVCGEAGIRNPGTNQFLCMQHHAEAGNHLKLTVGNTPALASCLTEDVSSPNHEWEQVRGARFRCIRCQRAEKYDVSLLNDLREKSSR